MPRRVRTREPGDDPTWSAGNDARRQWLGKWKTWAVGQLASDTSASVKTQLRVDVERALSRYRPDDDEAEIRDAVSAIVAQTNAQIETKVAGQLQGAAKALMIALAPVFLRDALAKFDRSLVAAMLKRPESSRAALTARLQRHLERQLGGDEGQNKIQRLADAWVARRLAEQPPVSNGRLGSALGAAGIVATAGLAAYQHPSVKTAVNQGLEKARQFVQKWTPAPSPPPPDGSKPS